ncbi:MAG: S8/S53 family peptidase [Alphaproteobacteria bacterium]|nr:S8/S53 family peptidase [Alphaproteobacteria bacterium]
MKKTALSFLFTLGLLVNSINAAERPSFDGDHPWHALRVYSLPEDRGGIIAAVVDSGFDWAYTDLRSCLAGVFNGRDNTSEVMPSYISDYRNLEFGKLTSHGTKVASILARMNPSSKIYALKSGAPGNFNHEAVKGCLEHLVGQSHIQIINVSITMRDHEGKYWLLMEDVIRRLTNEGKTIVFSAGNDDMIMRDEPMGENRKLSDFLRTLNGRVIFAGATEFVHGVERKASFSNVPCASLQPFFIAVPGTNIKSFGPGQVTGSFDGTSASAPVLVGALVRLASEFNVTIDFAREVLLATAIKSSKINVDVRYTGEGVIDYPAARSFLQQRPLEQTAQESRTALDKFILAYKKHKLLQKERSAHENEAYSIANSGRFEIALRWMDAGLRLADRELESAHILRSLAYLCFDTSRKLHLLKSDCSVIDEPLKSAFKALNLGHGARELLDTNRNKCVEDLERQRRQF